MALTDRAVRAVRGEVALYEEVARDPAATSEALMIVGAAAVSLGVGSSLLTLVFGRPLAAVAGLVIGVIMGVLGWALFAGAVYLVSKQFFGATTVTWEEVLRPLGYAYTPLLIGIVGVIPCLGALVVFAAALWALYLAFIAIRATLSLETDKAIITIVASFITAAIIVSIIYFPLGIMIALL